MLKRRARLILGVVLMLGGLVVPSSGTFAQQASRPSAGKEWTTVYGDWSHTRYSTLDQINTSNVAKLSGAWMARLNGSGYSSKYSQQATPLVKDGVMYVTTGQQDVFALNARTGGINWQFFSDSDPKFDGLWANRGAALGDTLLFVGQTDGTMLALDQNTGKIQWKTQIGSIADRYYLAGAPLYANGVVYTGISGSDSGARGKVVALDAVSGTELWQFNTVPGPGEFGNDTWEGDSWMHGGGNVWVTPAIDPDLGMIYFNTGNAWPDYDGSVRGGDNLFTSSVVALDAKTGQYRWHFQTLHHEIWDFDAPNPVILFDADINGQPRKGIAEAGKTGWLYLLDRTNGKPLLGIEEQSVPQEPRQKTSQTQPVPVGDSFVPQCVDPVPGYIVGCMFDPFWDVPNVIRPGTSADWAPSAYSPQTGFMYVTASVRTRAYRVSSEEIVNGQRVITRPGGSVPTIGTRETGTLTAMDLQTNKIAWQNKMPYPIGVGSGVLATAGGLLFHGEPDGNFVAYDAQTGNELWRFQTGFGADAPAITYELDGTQYLAIATGGTSLAKSARGDGLWAFKLGGDVQPLYPPPAPQNLITVPGDLVATDSVSIGSSLLNGALVKDEYTFTPARVKASVGATLTWTNTGDTAHTASDQAGTWDTGLLAAGQSATVTFDHAGDFTYYCQPHPWMIGEVVVQ